MIKIKIISTTIISLFLASVSLAQQALPAGAVIRVINCSINDGYTFEEVRDRARALEQDENAPGLIAMRRPIYTTAQFQQNWDMQLVAYYPSYAELMRRRVARGNQGGRLPISCGEPVVNRAVNVHQGDGNPGDQTTMLTRYCNVAEGATRANVFNRIKEIAESYAREGSDVLTQMYMPGLGGPLDNQWDFVIAQVGSYSEQVMERLDMGREGFRAAAGIGSNSPISSCTRPSLWSSVNIHRGSQ
jgi:hypothetical protein